MILPTLDKWASFNDVLVGEALNHPDFEQRQRVVTNKFITIDKKDGWAACVANEFWQLGQPGKIADYIDPLSKRFY